MNLTLILNIEYNSSKKCKKSLYGTSSHQTTTKAIVPKTFLSVVFSGKRRVLQLDILTIWMGTKKFTQHVCKPKYIIDKALTSKTGGFITLRQNKEVDLTADPLLRVYQDISKEPALSTTTTTTNDDLQADMNSRGFW